MALLPLALVLLSVLLGGLYKLSLQFALTPSWRRRITTAHAIAIEIIQLLILLFGLAIQYFHIWALIHNETFTCRNIVIPAWIAIPSTLGIYVSAILAVDVVDNKIQLGRWRHSVQVQTLILTRSVLLPWTVTRRDRNNRPQPKDDEQPPADIQPFKSQSAVVTPRRYRSLSEPLTPTTSPFSEPSSKRRDSTPGPGSVARMVCNFEQGFVQTGSSEVQLRCQSLGPEIAVVDENPESSIGCPTPNSTPEKQAKPHDNPLVNEILENMNDIDGLEAQVIDEIIESLQSPDSIPEKPAFIVQPSIEQPTKVIPIKKPKQEAARHTAARARRHQDSRIDSVRASLK